MKKKMLASNVTSDKSFWDNAVKYGAREWERKKNFAKFPKKL